MPIEVNCSQCSALLRVADEHAGKKAKCPNCDAINGIPLTSNSYESNATGKPPQGMDYAGNNPHAENNPYSQRNPYSGSQPNYQSQQYGEPHRAGLVFALGIIGLLICLIPGIVAFFLGKSDLKKMREGRMDPSGEGLTQAGMIMGLISMILNALGLALFIVYIIFVVIVVAGAGANGF